MTETHNRAAHAALSTLIILQAVMLTALYAGIPPHPPEATPLFGIAPLLAAAFSAAGAAFWFGAFESRAGRAFCVIAALLAAVSFGPQKFLDPQFPLIWPAVVTGQIAILTLVIGALRHIALPNRTALA